MGSYPILARTLRDSRRALLGWGVGVMVLALITVTIWPSVKGQTELNDFIDELPDALLAVFGIEPGVDFLSPVGFVNSRVYASLGPLLMLMFAIGFGVRAIAGEEERGTLDLLLSHPVTRARVVVEKFAALVGLVLGVGLVLFLGVWLGSIVFDIDLTAGGIAAATVAITLLAVMFGTLALALGAATGRRSLSMGVAAAVAVGTYFLWSLAPIVDFVDAIDWLSPWFYAQDDVPLANGLPILRALVLVGLTTTFLAAAVWGFRRRDIGV